MERARLIHELLTEEPVIKKDMAKLLGKSSSYISNHLRLLKLPTVIQDALISGIISEGHARALSFLSKKTEVVQLFEEIIRYGYSVRRTEAKVSSLRTRKRTYGKVSNDIKGQIERFATSWQIEARVNRRGGKLALTLDFPPGVVGKRRLEKLLVQVKPEETV